MTLTLELTAELETALQEVAAQRGQDPATFALSAIAATVRQSGKAAPDMSESDFEAALDELEAIGAHIPAGELNNTYSREDIYSDHD